MGHCGAAFHGLRNFSSDEEAENEELICIQPPESHPTSGLNASCNFLRSEGSQGLLSRQRYPRILRLWISTFFFFTVLKMRRH